MAFLSRYLKRDVDIIHLEGHRHTYFYELKYEKIIAPLESADKLKGLYHQDIDLFLKTIENELT